jgi:formylglycine-generating enzyme required for sulfatase activity
MHFLQTIPRKIRACQRRDGSWGDNARATRSAYRDGFLAGFRYNFGGFRVVRELD